MPNSLVLTVNSPLGARFRWNTGDTTRQLTVAQPGEYAVTVSNFCGADSAFFRVMENEAPPITDQQFEFTLCPGDSLRFMPEEEASEASFRWGNGSDVGPRTFTQPGVYELARSNACSSAETFVAIVGLPEPPALGPPVSTELCEGEELRFVLPFFPETDYLWSSQGLDTLLVTDIAGDYFVVATNACGVDSTVFRVTPSESLPLRDSVFKLTLCLSDSIRFIPPLDASRAYRWQDDSLTGPIRNFFTSGTYVLQRSNSCFTAETTVEISAFSCCEVYLPTAFSPNGDGINDVFRPFPNEQYCDLRTNAQLRVYDRWGGEVFSGGVDGWDGRMADGEVCAAGSYAFLFSYADFGVIKEVSGVVVLLR
ncbi:MAG: gliding motility-associated C-terminal domain-containing protein [Lewinella sp.]